MTDPEKTNHWDSLASELGADPPPLEEKPRRSQPIPGTKPPSEGTRRAAAASKPQRRPTDWSSLANDLGVELPEEPSETSPPPEPSLAPVAKAAAGGDQPSKEQSRQGHAGTLAHFAPLELPGGAVDAEPTTGAREEEPEHSTRTDRVTTYAEAELTETDQTFDDFSGKRDEKRAGGRRRRRCPKTEKPSNDEPAEGSAKQSAEEECRDGDGDDIVLDASAVSGEESSERPRRRRRRRSPKKKGDLGRDEESAEANGLDQVPVIAGQDDSDNRRREPETSSQEEPGDLKKKGGRASEKSDKGSTSSRAGHRSIPTWEEAIGMVISANMEARAKKPGGGSSSRSRGGRNRGGRNKSGEKNG